MAVGYIMFDNLSIGTILYVIFLAIILSVIGFKTSRISQVKEIRVTPLPIEYFKKRNILQQFVDLLRRNFHKG